MPWHFFKAMQCCLEKGPNVVVLLGMAERERERGRERFIPPSRKTIVAGQ